MKLEVLLPFKVFAQETGVTRIVVQTRQGSFGLLPKRLDCIAALQPGILIYETEGQGEVCVAVDEGILVKTGPDVLISVRRALGGSDLARLREVVEQEFMAQRAEEQGLREVMGKLEAGFLRRLLDFRHV